VANAIIIFYNMSEVTRTAYENAASKGVGRMINMSTNHNTKCDVICENLCYGWTNIVGPGQTRGV